MEKNMNLLKNSHESDKQRIKKENNQSESVCDKQLERCENNLKDEKKEGEGNLMNL